MAETIDHRASACPCRPTFTDPDRLLATARAVLDRNWLRLSTVPSRSLYPHQWNWDSAFIAIGRSWHEQSRAQQELEALFEGQWSNGMLPHIVFDPDTPDDAYFPGPRFWQSERAAGCPPQRATSGITQPPLHARAALEIYQQASHEPEARAFLERMYPKLVAQLEYLAGCRDVTGNGLVAIVHPWESGLDNSPAFDHVLDALVIPDGALPSYERRDLVHADPTHRPTDDAYDRFVYLALAYREVDYDDAVLIDRSPFLLEGPLFNAIYLWSIHALAEIAGIVGGDRRSHRAAARRVHDALLDELWSDEAGRFVARDARTGDHDPSATIISFMPLLDPELPPDIVERLVGLLESPCFHPAHTEEHYIISSFDLDADTFDPQRYWRGPVWLNTNWLVWRGLRQHGRHDVAAEVGDSMAALVDRSGFREYFSPLDGAGFGSDDFSWSAALLIDRLLRDPPAV